MKRTMRWMWEIDVVNTDEKGKPVKSKVLVIDSEEVPEDQKETARKVKVAHYTPKEAR